MKVLMSPGYEILYMDPVDDRERMMRAAQVCYKSERDMDEEAQKGFVRRLHELGHSIPEHSSVTIKLICDRGTSHQIVRHRAGCSFAQESTRYCNYSKDKFGNQITVVKPVMLVKGTEPFDIWYRACLESERAYLSLLEKGVSPEDARGVLPTSLKTELVVTTNLKEWYHILAQRTKGDAHPDTRALCMQVLAAFAEQSAFPEIFGDLYALRRRDYLNDMSALMRS